MNKAIVILSVILSSFASKATTHIVNVWDGYFQFVDALNFSPDITIQLGDTVQWLPLDVPTMVHTITSSNIPAGAAAFDAIWQAPADTFFQYVPQVAGLYEYVCTPHEKAYGMVGSINVIGKPTGIITESISEINWSVYPNPTTDSFRFTESSSVFAYNMFTHRGELVLSGRTDEIVNVSMLSDGVYYVEIISDIPRILKFVKL